MLARMETGMHTPDAEPTLGSHMRQLLIHYPFRLVMFWSDMIAHEVLCSCKRSCCSHGLSVSVVR